MAKKPTLSAALKALQANLTSRTAIPEDHMAVLREMLAGRRVLTLSGTALDIDQIEADVAHLDLTGDDSAGDDLKTLDEALQSARPALPACPITGQALRLVKGKAGAPDRLLTRDSIDWQPLTTEQREVAAYAVSIGAISPTSAAAESAVYGLQQKPLPPPWPRLTAAWVALRDKPKKTPAEAAQVASVQARLTFQRQEAPAAAGSSFPAEQVSARPEPAPVPQPGVRTCASCGRAENDHDVRHPFVPQGEAPVSAPGAVRIVVVSSPKDRDFVDDLRANLAGPLRAGRVTLFDQNIDIKPGADTSAVVADEVRRADIFLYVCTSDMLASRGSDVQTWVTTFTNARHIPVLVKPCMLEYSALTGKVPLPPGGKPSRDAYDSIAGLMKVVTAIVAARR